MNLTSVTRAVALLIISTPVASLPIVIDADDYPEGQSISFLSPYVTLTTASGDPVYSSVINDVDYEFLDSEKFGLLGRRVFSRDPHLNSEWYYWPDEYPADYFTALELNFIQPVRSFSLLMAEVYPDAGYPSFPDPYHIDLFDVNGAAIEGECAPHRCRSELVVLDETNPEGSRYAHWKVTYVGAEPVSRIILGGESEPTTIDRLTFSFARQVPEASTLALFLVGLVGIGVRALSKEAIKRK